MLLLFISKVPDVSYRKESNKTETPEALQRIFFFLRKNNSKGTFWKSDLNCFTVTLALVVSCFIMGCTKFCFPNDLTIEELIPLFLYYFFL